MRRVGVPGSLRPCAVGNHFGTGGRQSNYTDRPYTQVMRPPIAFGASLEALLCSSALSSTSTSLSARNRGGTSRTQFRRLAYAPPRAIAVIAHVVHCCTRLPVSSRRLARSSIWRTPHSVRRCVSFSSICVPRQRVPARSGAPRAVQSADDAGACSLFQPLLGRAHDSISPASWRAVISLTAHTRRRARRAASSCTVSRIAGRSIARREGRERCYPVKSPRSKCLGIQEIRAALREANLEITSR